MYCYNSGTEVYKFILDVYIHFFFVTNIFICYCFYSCFLQDESYKEVLRQLLHMSDDQFEVWLVARALGDHLTPLESLAVEVITTVHRTLPDLITLPPQSV